MGNAYRSVLAGGGAGTPITPSNSSPPALSAGNIYKPGSSGYAIGSYSNISPSSSGTYFSSGMKKMSSSGYAYSSQAKRIKRGTGTASTTTTTTVNVGFQPSAVMVQLKGTNTYMLLGYDSGGIDGSYSWRGNINAGGTSGWNRGSVPSAGAGQNQIKEITSNGFVIGAVSSGYGPNFSYIAVE